MNLEIYRKDFPGTVFGDRVGLMQIAGWYSNPEIIVSRLLCSKYFVQRSAYFPTNVNDSAGTGQEMF